MAMHHPARRVSGNNLADSIERKLFENKISHECRFIAEDCTLIANDGMLI